MTTKKENAKRLGIYLLIVFLFISLPFIFRRLINESNTAYFIIYYLFSFSPAIASLITRAVTGEGFRDLKLHLNLRGNFRWYLLAFGLPLICFTAAFLLPVVFSGHTEWLGGFTFRNVLSCIFTLAALSAVQSIGLLGEELGWRGYMNQKMEPLFGTAGTCLLGGIVWSLWHLPMDMAVYNDGEGALPDLLMMCGGRMVMLTCFGTFLLWLTKKTDSIFPAVIGHYMFNESQRTLADLLWQGNIPENAASDAVAGVSDFLPMIIIAAVFIALLLRDSKKAAEPSFIRNRP